MKTKHGRLLLTLFVGAWLIGIASSCAQAGLSLSCSPGDATVNSVWNYAAVWQDDDDASPFMETHYTTEGTMDYGLLDGAWVNYTTFVGNGLANPSFASIRQPIPDLPSDKVDLWPRMTAPDGYPGFATPTVPAEILPGERFQSPAYASVQPDPVHVDLEADGAQYYDHGVDYIDEYLDTGDGKAGISLGTLVAAPLDPDVATHFIPQAAIASGTDTSSKPVIVLPRAPVALVGIWTDAMHTNPVKAKITTPNAINKAWPQKYNVIVITDERDIFSLYTRLYISYYCAGTHYVLTKQAPLPLPYTVYAIPLTEDGDNFLRINDSILHFDPLRTADPSLAGTINGDLNKNTSVSLATQSGLMGVYTTPKLEQGSDITNHCNLSLFAAGEKKYVLNNGLGKLYFNTIPALPAAFQKAGAMFYVKVSTNAVDGVWTDMKMLGTNYYLRSAPPASAGKPIGYCARSGIIRLGTPLPDPDVDATIGTWVVGQQAFVKYRALSDRTYTVGRNSSVGYVGMVDDLRPVVPPATPYAFKPETVTYLPGGKFSIGDPLLPPFGTYAVRIQYSPDCGEPILWLNGSIPMNYVSGSARGGMLFRVAVTAGLNMSDSLGQPNKMQRPSVDRTLNLPSLNNRLIYDPRGYPMYREVALSPSSVPVKLAATGWTVKDGKLVVYSGDVSVNVHDSRTITPMINYGGVVGSLDSLTCVSDVSQPAYTDVDPLSVEPLEEANPTFPDDGSSSTQFVFRIRYSNGGGLQPLPWLHEAADLWALWGAGSNSGVVLYLDQNGTGDYRPHFMRRENPELPSAAGGAGDVYLYRIIPHSTVGVLGSGMFPFQYWWRTYRADGTLEDNQLYESLGCGTYHYFFACSDDSLIFDDPAKSYPFEHQSSSHMGGPTSKTGLEEWGQVGGLLSSTGLDPSAPRAVSGYGAIDRAEHRRYSANGVNIFDYTLFVDRTVRAPGEFESSAIYHPYQFPSELHPRVSCELLMPSFDDFLKRYDDTTYGYGRFFGTLFPYRSAVNPVMAGARSTGSDAQRSESSGSYSKDTNVFKILYKQIDDRAPISIQLWINDASEKSPADAAHAYRAYTMSPRADQTVLDYRTGVWYEYKLQSGSTQLPLGPHTYYFMANDGEHVARWPVRPDWYIYNTLNLDDWWVPTESQASERRTPGYMDNDYAPGPYVNHAPQASNVSVTPGTGKEGARFLYKATYSDADGQRVYGANITIEVNDRGDRRTLAMVPDPKYNLDPTADNSAIYKTGVDFILDTATYGDLALERGVRRFYIEFTDDWGRQNDVNDLRQGETVRYPEGDGNWVSGPVISGNMAPTLSNGRADSVDGTANAATLWTFRANYRDINNDAPALIKLFIGQLQPPDKTVPVDTSKVKTIVWDAGHTMIPSDPTDTVYSDGADFYYQTRLGGPVSGSPAIQYYYAFEAYDGIDYAAYKNSSSDNLRSDAAGCFTLQDAERLDETHFKIRTKVAKQLDVSTAATVLDPDPARVGDIVRIWGVYANEDLLAPNYYDSGGSIPALYAGGTITLNGTLPAGRAWVVCEAETPIVGPLPVEQPAPPGVIPDAEVYKNASSSGKALLLTDQKNGYISEQPNPDGTRDRAVVLMEGVAAYEGKPTSLYVAPDSPDTIASVEGVYWLDDLNPVRRYQNNYYDPAKVSPPVSRLGTLDAVANTVTLDDPDEVYKVLGVYDNSDLTGTNYYAGAGYPIGPGALDTFKWQEAFVLTKSLVWPKYPMDIVSIKGVYLSLNETTTSYVAPVPPSKSVPYSPTVSEFVTLTTNLVPLPISRKVYIAYYSVGDMDPTLGIPLFKTFPNGATPYVKIWAKGFNPGDKYIKLTTKLPDISIDATVIGAGEVRPTDSKYLSEIGEVTGVFIAGDATNYYTGTLNPFKIGDATVHLGELLYSPPATSPAGAVTITYLPKQRAVTIKYSDIRYTHLFTGLAKQVASVYYDPFAGNPYPTMASGLGTTHFVPDGWAVGNINITGNTLDPDTGDPREVDGGVVGVWLNPDFTGINYFNPRRVNLYNDNLLLDPASTAKLRLSADTPTGTAVLYARAYQKGVYFIDRWNRPIGSDPDYTLRFEQNSNVDDLDRIQVSYFFGTKMPKVLVPNTLPSLAEGKVTPIAGSRNTQYVYSVKYTDIDGPNGQVPAYVRVYIDGVPFDMVSAVAGTPVYKSGAMFTFTPSGGLVGGSHTYHFEASDGAAIAWFDNVFPYSHNTERALSSSDVVDMNGPWVNDPPQLANGLVAPNPVPGGISTRDSVDYTVNLRDLDNDPPYFFDPLRDTTGNNVSGSPRLWVDASVNDDTAVPMIGTITGLEDDPLEPGKKRVIVVQIDDGTGNLIDPSWTPDQFAGKLMQITNGDKWGDVFPTPYLRVYLIQSNTANKLVIATDSLLSDMLLVPNDPATSAPRYVQFRINGLLMTKLDATQENYALGVDYKITVPRLAVGAHKFHFTARTRETKPLWLLNMVSYTNKDAYSILVRFPTLGDVTGPNVISITPPGNRAPVLSKIGLSTLYRGPKPQYATVLSPSRATPSNYNALLSVAGVYVNANFDAHLALAQQKDYFDTTTTNPPATGDPVKLSPNLRALPDTGDLIQHGIATDLLTVTPDVASAIGSVSAVYLGRDPTLAGTAYAPTSPNLGVNNKITLTSALPVGTTDVYIKYRPATAAQAGVSDGTGDNVLVTDANIIAYVVGVYLPADTAMANNLAAPGSLWVPGQTTSVPLAGGGPIWAGVHLVVKYVPWPPVYIKYFSVEPTNARPPIHGIFTAGEPLTFKILYSDADGDPPTYHDGVQGYVKIVFNDTGRTSQLVPMGIVTTYVTGVPFGVTLTDVPEGTHPYHFEASDGYVVTRFPADQGNTGANDEKVQVNYKPSLRTGGVDHSSGSAASKFTFGVTYADSDNVAPATGGFVQVILTNHADATKTYTISMTTSETAPNYSTGVRYSGTANQDGSLLPAQYDTVFVANDGVQDANPLPGPTIVVRPGENTPPVIVNYEVKKLLTNGQLANGAGKTSDTFVYRAWYMDVENDAPVYVAPSGQRQTALTLIIDKDQTTEQRVAMMMVALPQPPPPSPPAVPDYTLAAGVEFQARVTGKRLGPGNHTYTVVASDGTATSTFSVGIPTSKTGPILMIPFFQIAAVGKDGEPITDRSIVGQEVLITGTMYFPYTTPDEQPSSISNITIQVAKPDSTAVSLNASLANIRTSSAANPQNWLGDIVVKYSGYVDPALITGQSLTLTASGQWVLSASWPGNTLYDGAETDSTMDGHNDQVRITVSGPSRTVAVANPLQPETSTPVVDMITPPMIVPTSPGPIFGYDRALALQIVRWSPSSGQYFWYDVGGVFPAMMPGDAVWIKPKLGTPSVPGSGYPAAESLGSSYVIAAVPTSSAVVPMNVYASHINGVYLNSSKAGVNYYVYGLAVVPYKSGDNQIVLTGSLPSGTAQVWVDYVGSQSGVDEGWIALDSPLIQKALVAGDPRFVHSKYRMVKVLAQAYPLLTGLSGSPVLDPETKLPLLKPCSVSLSTGWNQFGNIFFNWKTTWQAGTPATDTGQPPGPFSNSAKSPSVQAIDQWNVVPVQASAIGKVLGVYLNQQLAGTNYYQPGISTLPYRRGDTMIRLTQAIPATTTTVYIKYEAYPREDVGIPFNEVRVTYLGVTKSLADAKIAGWILDYGWRYDAAQHNYVRVSDTVAGSERVLKAWSGYWIKAYVSCQLEIDPNTKFNGVFATAATTAAVGEASSETIEMPPPAPD